MRASAHTRRARDHMLENIKETAAAKAG
jgi:hypothetical protein